LWFASWITLNLLLPEKSRFDPFPFSFLTLIVSLESIFLSVFILTAQNIQGRLNDRRAHLDLQINLLSEQENTKMLELLDKIACKLGVSTPGDEEVSVMAEAISPENLADQIDRTMGKSAEGIRD